ncbi:hypothetical protein DL767_002301 [Monosporascus sp. MG133]|nr:hypothetical protein DL767_002301 [Monosporascus sp. MG133]
MVSAFTRAALLGLALSCVTAAEPVVQLEKSKVTYRGSAKGSIEHFQNIRFAHDTSGARRFAPPELYTPPEGSEIDATAPGSACPQSRPGMPPFFVETPDMDEDCLNLRISRPAGTTAEDKLPVVVWLHGGGVVKGSAYDPHFDPENLITLSASLEKPIIYVALNYRITIFGFARLPILEEQKSLNIGMRDQRAGFQWIKDNIAAFGGDPDKITAFGLSAGGTFISLHLMAYSGEQGVPFSQVWAMSGPPGTALNITSDATETHTPLISLGIPMVFGWTQDDGAMNAGPAPHFEDEEAMKGPVKSFAHALTDDDYEKLFSLYPTADFEEEARNYEARKDGSDPVAPVHYFRVSRILRDMLFTCSSIDFSYEMSRQSKAIDSTFPGVRLYDLNQSMLTSMFKGAGMPYLGVCHGSDTNYIFNGLFPEGEVREADQKLSTSIAASFINFAYTGSPVNPDDEDFRSWPEAFPEPEGLGEETVSGPPRVNLQLIGGPLGTGPCALSGIADDTRFEGAQQGSMQHPLMDGIEFGEMESAALQGRRQKLERRI